MPWCYEKTPSLGLYVEYTSGKVGGDDWLLHRVARLMIKVREHDNPNIYVLMYIDEGTVRL